ncbi:MAG: universal stress protein [Nitrospirae bacterium]|nr:universal stress protein [Nitrospirota bacterium]
MSNSATNRASVQLNIQKILVPTDFSECSERAMAYAGSLARDFKARIILLHVIESSVYALDTSLMPPGDPLGLRQKLIEMTEQRVNRLKESGLEADGYCVTGVPSIEIIKAAREVQADLVVMGTRGRTGLAHILLGSTAERVIQRAQCPVLTVKAETMRAEKGEKKQTIEEKRNTVKELVPPGENLTFCHLCAQPSHDIICDACKVRVQSEAFDMKQRVEKEGRADTGRR